MRRLDVCIGEIRLRARYGDYLVVCECGAFALFVSICSVVGFDYFVSIVLLIFFFQVVYSFYNMLVFSKVNFCSTHYSLVCFLVYMRKTTFFV